MDSEKGGEGLTPKMFLLLEAVYSEYLKNKKEEKGIMKRHLNLLSISFIIFFMVLGMMVNVAVAQETTNYQDLFTRSAKWWEQSSNTTWTGGTSTYYKYGPDLTAGPAGWGYEISDPMSGYYMSYSVRTTSPGAIMNLPGWSGMPGSDLAKATYGPLYQTAVFGMQPTTAPTWGANTQYYTSGSVLGSQQYINVQPVFSIMNWLGGIGSLLGGGQTWQNYPGYWGGASTQGSYALPTVIR